MATVPITFTLGFADDTDVADGLIRISRLQPANINGRWMLPTNGGRSLTVPAVGVVSNMEASTYFLVEHMWPASGSRIIQTPASGAANYGNLPSIDPATLLPAADLTPAWQAQFDALNTAIGLRVLTTTYTAGLALKSNLASPTFTGTVTVPQQVLTGSLRYPLSVRTASATLTTTDIDHQMVNATTGNMTITLPATTTAGNTFIIKKIDSSANTVTVAATSIDGVTNYVLASQWSYVRVISTTTSGTWYIIGR